jgi:hypothetical protein
MNYLALPLDVRDQTQIFKVHSSVASGQLDISLQRKTDEVIIYGRTTLKSLGGFVTALHAETSGLFTKGPDGFYLSKYKRALKFLGKEKNVEATDVPPGALDHVSMVFAVQSHFEKVGGESNAKVFLYDGKKAIDLFIRRSTNDSRQAKAGRAQLEISRDEAFSDKRRVSDAVEISIDSSTSRIVQMAYTVSAFGRINIETA